MDWLIFFFGLGAALMTVGPALISWVWARRRAWPWLVLAGAAVFAGIAWWIDVYLVFSGAGDLSGVMDCYPDCSVSQEAATGILGYVPLVMAVVLAIVLLMSVTRRLRTRASGRARVDAGR